MLCKSWVYSIITGLAAASCVSSYPAKADTTRNDSRAKSVVSTSTPAAKPSTMVKQTSAKPQTDAADPDRIQEHFQREFARELAAAGPKAEGWALFSEGGMSYPGQRWLIRPSPDKPMSLCIIRQTDKTCTRKSVTKEQFAKAVPVFKKADQLTHLLPVSFDGVNFEYLHARSGVPLTNRVVFITSANPFPADYEAIVATFQALTQ